MEERDNLKVPQHLMNRWAREEEENRLEKERILQDKKDLASMTPFERLLILELREIDGTLDMVLDAVNNLK
jgi:hypothetical protein